MQNEPNEATHKRSVDSDELKVASHRELQSLRRDFGIPRGHGARDGRTLDNPTCLRIRMEAGKPSEVWEFVWDLYQVDEFWA